MIGGRTIRNLFCWPSLRLRAEKDSCGKCGRCTRECPMSLPVQEMVAADRMERAECILCGSCVDNCPKGAIKYTWRAGRSGEPASVTRTASTLQSVA